MKMNGLRTLRICVRTLFYFSKMPNRAKEESKGGDQRVVDVMSTVLRADALLWSRDKKRILRQAGCVEKCLKSKHRLCSSISAN